MFVVFFFFFKVDTEFIVLQIVELDRQIINDDRVTITVLPSYNPHPISPHDSKKDRPYSVLKKTIQQIHPEAVVSPSKKIIIKYLQIIAGVI